MIGFLNSELVALVGTPLLLILIFLEILLSVKFGKQHYTVRDTRENVLLSCIYLVTDLVTRGGGLFLLSFFCYYGIALTPQDSYAYWISLFLLVDVSYWLMHFIDHHCRLLWAGHITHHSSKQFNLTVGIRASIFQPVEKFLFFIPIAFIGYQPLDIILIYVLTQMYGTFIHTKSVRKLGVLEYVLVTPSHHRVHHAKNVQYLDKNFGMTLIIWDRLFGTFKEEEDNVPIEFGVTTELENPAFNQIVFGELSSIISDVRQKGIGFRHRLKYIFGLPGYSHNGQRKTTRQLRQGIKEGGLDSW